MTDDVGDQPKAIAPPCAIGELLAALDADSTAAALRHRRDGRPARLYYFLVFPLHVLWAYAAQRPPRLGVLGFTLAALRAYSTFMAWAKVWEAQHCDAAPIY